MKTAHSPITAEAAYAPDTSLCTVTEVTKKASTTFPTDQLKPLAVREGGMKHKHLKWRVAPSFTGATLVGNLISIPSTHGALISYVVKVIASLGGFILAMRACATNIAEADAREKGRARSARQRVRTAQTASLVGRTPQRDRQRPLRPR
jgi:hypothetical protein